MTKIYVRKEEAQKEKAGYMSQLETWIDEQVIEPLCQAFTDGDKDETLEATEAVKKAIKDRVLASFRNGQNAPAKEAYQGQKNRSNFRKPYGQKGARRYVRKA